MAKFDLKHPSLNVAWSVPVQHVLYMQSVVLSCKATQHVFMQQDYSERKLYFIRFEIKIMSKGKIFTNMDMCSFIMKSKNLSHHFFNYFKPFGPEQYYLIDDAISSELLFLECPVRFTTVPSKFLSRQELMIYSYR